MTTVVNEESEQEVLPALYEHCVTVYERMEREAILDDGVLIWQGHLTKLFAAEHLSVPYYTSVTRELKRMGCIAQKRRGGGNAPSQWWIKTAPTEEAWREDNPIRTSLTSQRRTKLDSMQQQLTDMNKRLNRVETDYALILEVLQERENGN